MCLKVNSIYFPKKCTGDFGHGSPHLFLFLFIILLVLLHRVPSGLHHILGLILDLFGHVFRSFRSIFDLRVLCLHLATGKGKE